MAPVASSSRFSSLIDNFHRFFSRVLHSWEKNIKFSMPSSVGRWRRCGLGRITWKLQSQLIAVSWAKLESSRDFVIGSSCPWMQCTLHIVRKRVASRFNWCAIAYATSYNCKFNELNVILWFASCDCWSSLPGLSLIEMHSSLAQVLIKYVN